MTFRAAVVPAAPVYTTGVTRTRTPAEDTLRQAMLTAIAWAAGDSTELGIDADTPLVGLGPYGIDRGVDMRTGQLLTGSAWQDAVVELTDEAARQAVHDACARAGSAALLAVEAGLTPVPLDRAQAALITFDFSATSTPDGPLAPVEGAPEHDRALMEAIQAGQAQALTHAARDARTYASNTESLQRLLSAHGQPDVHVDFDAETLGTRTAVLRMEFP
ncbi:hypothetical protein CYJ40_10440 [Brevibacterium ravenspurgense]|uniref:Uncharacterized protein n=1 Tax=Brevibacterium ravenspurgense TaxID=479117 RepID=A0A2I1IEA3_9MICO|nr:hypothetical protein CYJ40_10440 [Brevibacterium ravenspurgense]